MPIDNSVPQWLWRAAKRVFSLTLLTIAALAIALANGLADPPRVGPLLWQDNFKGDVGRWHFITTDGASLAPRAGALIADFTGPDQSIRALTDGPIGDFTLEIAAAQTAGEIGARYGLAIGWRAKDEHTVVWLNGNGYAEAFTQAGPRRTEGFPFQQWPHILYGTEANRVRVDVRGSHIIVRINDELLAAFEADARGQFGLIARSSGAGRVVFSWVKVWATTWANK
ncbi:MAG: hypothetical protein ACT4QE_06500 [Anaerolineales bacterium]